MNCRNRNGILLTTVLLLAAAAARGDDPVTSIRPWKGKGTWKLDAALFRNTPEHCGPVPAGDSPSWYQHMLVGSYDVYGLRHSWWDVEARAALRISADFWAATNCITAQDRLDACIRAIEAGCEDPAVLYHYAVSRTQHNQAGEAEDRGLFARAAERLAASCYPPIVKSWSFLYAARQQPASHGGRTETQSRNMTLLLDAAFVQLSRVVGDPDVPSRDLTDLCDEYMDTYRRRYGNPEPGFEKLVRLLRDTRPSTSAVPDIIAGDHLLAQAWAARGSGFADTVTEHGWDLFRQFHRDAETAYRRAWKHDNRNPRIAFRLIRITAENGEREEMEQWFQRAMILDPNYYAACHRKLFYLTPKWGGSEEEMMDFARECYDTGNWEGRLPFILEFAHGQLAGSSGYPSKDVYYLSSNVWNDIESVYRPYLELYPESSRDRSHYALYATRAHRWDVAHQQFERLGDDAWERVFGGRDLLNALRDEARQRAAGLASAAPTRLPPELALDIAEGRQEKLEAWIAAGGDVNAVNERGVCALALAIDADQFELVEWLLEKGAHINKQNPLDRSPLQHAIRGRHEEIAIFLIERGADVAERAKDGGNLAMEEALSRRLLPVAESLLDHGLSVEWKDRKRNTLLHRAAIRGYPEFVELLMQRGANPDARNSWQYTPLMSASAGDDADGVRALLEKGAPVDSKTGLDTTALTIAAYRGHAEIIRLLLDHGADINNLYKQDGRTPIMAAAEGGHVDAVALFLARGADRTLRDKQGKTALEIARERGHAHIVRLLETPASAH